MAYNFNKDLDEYVQGNITTSPGDEDRVLCLVLSLGASFPSEIARKLLLSVEQVNALLTKLINKELVVNLLPDHWHPQPLIKCQIPRMRMQGIVSYEQFILRSWYIASEKGFWLIADRSAEKHQQKRVNDAYLHTYPNIKYFDDFNTEQP